MALALPQVEEGSSYGAPALKVKGKLFVRLREDLDSIVLKMPFERREELMAADPETYYITDHYREYEWVLVRLSKVDVDALSETAADCISRGLSRDAASSMICRVEETLPAKRHCLSHYTPPQPSAEDRSCIKLLLFSRSV